MTDFLGLAQQMRAGGNAEGCYQYLVAQVRNEPTPEAWDTLGKSLHELGRVEGAIAAFSRGGDGHETLVNLGWNRHMVGRSDEAEAPLRRAVEIAPGEAIAWADLSQCLLRLGKNEHALAASSNAVSLSDDPSFGIAHAMSLFANGRWEEGFRVYEARIPFKLKVFEQYPYPRWDGGYVERLLIQAEMGIGDCLWMLRWVPEASERVGKVLLFVHAELLTLVQRWAVPLGNIEVYAMPRELPEVDAFVPMLSLPLVIGMGDSLSGAPYISSFGRTGGPIRKVGIVWASSPESEEAKWRDIPLLDFMPLLEMPEIEVHSVQMGAAKQEIDQRGLHAFVRDRSAEISNFADTQGIVAGLDLVIGCDTAVMHLAGAMGKRAWMLRNQRAAPWIWPYSSGLCPWYKSMQVLCRTRQEQTWAPLMQCVVAKLRWDRTDAA